MSFQGVRARTPEALHVSYCPLFGCPQDQVIEVHILSMSFRGRCARAPPEALHVSYCFGERLTGRDTKRSWTRTTESGLACTRCPKLLNRVQGDFIQMHGLTPAAGYYQPYAQTVSVRDYGAGSSTHPGAAENVGISSRWKSSRCISCAFGGLTTNCMQARAETSVKCSDRIGPEFPPCLGGPYLNEGSSMRYFVPSILFGLTAHGRPS